MHYVLCPLFVTFTQIKVRLLLKNCQTIKRHLALRYTVYVVYTLDNY